MLPLNCLDNPRAPYLFRRDGTAVTDQDHLVMLEELDEHLEEYDDGPFLCGDEPTVADFFWVPHLERYAAMLPGTRRGDPLFDLRGWEYPAITAWFRAMEGLPNYGGWAAGDLISWERILERARYENAVPSLAFAPSAAPIGWDDAMGIWKRYLQDRPHLAPTPKVECATFVVRHRHALRASVAAEIRAPDGDADAALREAVQALLRADGPGSVSVRGQAAMRVLDRELRAPRDMGLLAMAPLWALAGALAAGEE